MTVVITLVVITLVVILLLAIGMVARVWRLAAQVDILRAAVQDLAGSITLAATRAQAVVDATQTTALVIEQLRQEFEGLAQTVAYLAHTIAEPTETQERHP